ncbi:hypothetical protein SBBP1_510010 [Burkholderiales bacterium]|nr:hypothetical protein SBBP1_510010 [Burkholderiales bacterium]
MTRPRPPGSRRSRSTWWSSTGTTSTRCCPWRATFATGGTSCASLNSWMWVTPTAGVWMTWLRRSRSSRASMPKCRSSPSPPRSRGPWPSAGATATAAASSARSRASRGRSAATAPAHGSLPRGACTFAFSASKDTTCARSCARAPTTCRLPRRSVRCGRLAMTGIRSCGGNRPCGRASASKCPTSVASVATRVPARESITGVILAGGRGARMGGADKGLVAFNGRALVAHVLARLQPQVAEIIISANRNVDRYRVFGHRVVQDDRANFGPFAGPLAGMLAGLRQSRLPWVAFVPCDAPALPLDLVAALERASQGGRELRRAAPAGVLPPARLAGEPAGRDACWRRAPTQGIPARGRRRRGPLRRCQGICQYQRPRGRIADCR